MTACVLAVATSAGGSNRLPATELPRVPAGFQVELVAGPPLVERPVMACFDDRGRLYLVDSAGVNLRFTELEKDKPHSNTVLDNTDSDSRYDQRRV